MALSIIDAYKNALIEGNLGEDHANDNPTDKYVRINTCSKKIGQLYLEADYFNEQTLIFIKNKLKAREATTDPYFNFQIVNAYNILYLDGDWSDANKRSTIEYQSECSNRASADMKLALAFLAKQHITIEHHHIWVPSEFPINDSEAKMGYHSFIVCEENIDKDMRRTLVDYVRSNCTYGTSVIDESPVQSAQSLLPFATKVGKDGKLSRAYALSPDFCKFNPKIRHYANASVQNVSTTHNAEQEDIPLGPDHLRAPLEDDDEYQSDAEECISEPMEEEDNFLAEEEDTYEGTEEESAIEIHAEIQADFSSGWDDECVCEEEAASTLAASEGSEESLELDPLVAEMTKRPDNTKHDSEADKQPIKGVSKVSANVSTKRSNKKISQKINLDEAIKMAMQKAHSSFKEEGWTTRYGVSNRIVFEFIDSLKYMRPCHRLFRMLSNEPARVKKIFPLIMRYLYVNYTVDSEGRATFDVGQMSEVMVRLMKPLVELAFRYHKNNEKHDIEGEIRGAVAYWFQHYGVDGMFSPTNKQGEIVNLIPVYRDYLKNGRGGDKRKRERWISDTENVYDAYDQLWIRHWTNRKKGEYYYHLWGDQSTRVSAETVDDAISDKTGAYVYAGDYRRFHFEKFCDICRRQVRKWVDFIKGIVMEGITKEIKPFSADHKDITFDEAFPDDFYDVPYNYGSISHYAKIMRLWCLMFLFTGFYESQDLNDSVRMIMTAFTRKFIWIDSSKKEPITWLYNIKQTNSLEAYPYNQWIEDPKGSETEQWMSVIYDRFVRPSLLTIDRNYNMDALLGTMDAAGIGLDGNAMKKLKPFGNLGTEIGTICKNVFKTFGGNPRPKMLHAAQADYFPMRNGWLKWVIKDGQPTGDYEFLTDTQDLYMGRYTQVNWSGPLEDYDKNSIEYRAVKRVIEQIYPDEEGREYCMRHFASVLYGTGYKDRLFVMYGTGSDGKTTIVNAVQALLGQSGFGADATVFENGKHIALNRNLKGLASTMKAEALLVNASAKSSHDEAGISEAVDVRLCNTQEPQLDNKGRVTLNGATIKGILSGTASSTRKIYQEATSSVINALIIMQTNYKPYVDDPTDGLKRRFTMYQHKSKFITNESSSFKDTEYHFKADAAVAKALTDEPKYWQALFYILLEYAQKNLRERYLPLSKIPMPGCVEETCEEIFTKYVISVMGAISNVTEKVNDKELGIINFNFLKDKLKKWNDKVPNQGEELNHPYRFCESRKPDDVDKEITRGLVQYFGGHMYRLKEEPTAVISDDKSDYDYIERKYGKNKNVGYRLVPGSKSLIEFAQENSYNTETFKSKFLRRYAMTTIDSTGCGKKKDEGNADVYIVGWKMVDGLESTE